MFEALVRFKVIKYETRYFRTECQALRWIETKFNYKFSI